MEIINLSGLGNWELTYFQKHTGDLRNKGKAPLIEPIELPYLTDNNHFLVGATNVKAPLTWIRAGYFVQQIAGVSVDDTVIFDLPRVPTLEVDGAKELIKLNTVQYVNFPKLSSDYRLRFDPVSWMPEITLAVWEYRGPIADSTAETLDAIRAKLEVIDFKLSQT